MTEPTEVRESAIAIGAIGIQRRVVLRAGKDDIAFSTAIDSTADRRDIYELMDTIGDVADRERLKVALDEKRDALRVAQEQPRQIEKDILRLRAQRAAFIASRELGGVGKRPLGEKQRLDLEKFDNELRSAELAKATFAKDLPLIEWEIRSLEARIAGREPPARPEGFGEVIEMLQGAAA